MSAIDLNLILKEISPEAPSGDKDLVGCPEFVELQEKIDKIDGNIIVKEDKKPKWPEIQDAALELLTQTHHLQVAIYLTRALLNTKGLAGFKDGLSLIQGFVEQHWDTLYPRSQDKKDPFERMSILESLCDYNTIIKPLLNATLCSSRSLGHFNLRAIRISTGNKLGLVLSDEEKKSPPSLSTIEAAFKECESEEVQATSDSIKASLRIMNELKTALKKKIGSKNTPDFEELNEVLTEMDLFLEKQLEGRNTPNRVPTEQNSEKNLAEMETIEHPVETVDTSTEKTPVKINNREKSLGEINNRQDIVRVLDHICTYYKQYEPSSPVPLLLQRARHLVEKDFFEIVEDLAPESLAQIKKFISGATDDAS